MLGRMDGERLRSLFTARFTNILAAITALTLTALAILYAQHRLSEYAIVKWATPLLVVEFTALTAALWYGASGAVARLLSLRPLVYLGTISYGIYLYHLAAHYLTWHVMIGYFGRWHGSMGSGLRMLVYLGISLGMAALSYHVLESRFLAIRERLRVDKPKTRPTHPVAFIGPSTLRKAA